MGSPPLSLSEVGATIQSAQVMEFVDANLNFAKAGGVFLLDSPYLAWQEKSAFPTRCLLPRTMGVHPVVGRTEFGSQWDSFGPRRARNKVTRWKL